jgi:hypothetical protein
MDLDRKLFACEQQLEQQGRIGCDCVGPLKPEFADRFVIGIDRAPGEQMFTSPGFMHNSRAGVFDRDDTLLSALLFLTIMASRVER